MRVVVLLKTAQGGLWSVPLASALRDAGHEVIFALPSEAGRLPDVVRRRGMAVVRAEAPLAGVGPAGQTVAVSRLRRQLASLEPAVVVSHLYASALAGRIGVWGTSIPHVFMSAGPLYLENRLIMRVERFAWHLDAHVICSSGALYRAYRDLGAPRDRLSLIPYAWDSQRDASNTPEQRATARRLLGIGEDQVVAVCVALFYAPKRLVHRGRGVKGHEDLLAAWDLYRRAGGTAELLIVGGGFGPGGDAYRRRLQEAYTGTPGVRWVDTAEDVRLFYQAADFSISPSISENLGAPAEASMLGVPSIATAVGGLPELVVDGWNGWLVPAMDGRALAGAIGDAAAMPAPERATYGQRARLRALELVDEGRNAAAFLAVVERVHARGVR